MRLKSGCLSSHFSYRTHRLSRLYAAKRTIATFSSSLPAARQVPVVRAPTFEEFRDSILTSDRPCLLQATIDGWLALDKWRDFTGLKRPEAASLVVPVEVSKIAPGETAGKGYNTKGHDGGWDRIEMPYEVFLDAFLISPLPGEPSGEGSSGSRWVGYLAQYPLLDEIPSLRADLSPSLPFLRSGRGDEWPTNMWIGTAGTFTPLHKDPYHNLFFQIVGTKHIRVFPPSSSEDLYISTDPLQRNTSLIPSPEPDPARFPRFHSALEKSWEVAIHPGEVLFIPRGFYHSVQSLTKSVSVNSWFL